MMGEGENNQQSWKEVVDQVGKQNVWSDADCGDPVINKTGLKGALPKQGGAFIIMEKTLVLFLGNQRDWLPL